MSLKQFLFLSCILLLTTAAFPQDGTFDDLTRRAGNGEIKAQVMLGNDYRDGNGVAQDYGQALSWYQKAAAQNSAEAANNLASMYYNGQGVAQDYSQALQWYQKAGDLGNPQAQYNLGLMYQNGLGVEQNYALAVQWYARLANAGSAVGQTSLGNMYLHGWGVSLDYSQAIDWFQRAAKQGNPDAEANLGLLYENGHGTKTNLAQATQWYRKAADQGNPIAENRLGTMYLNGSPGVAKDYNQAFALYSKAMQQGNAYGEANLGWMYQNGWSAPRDLTQAIQMYRKAADQGNVLGQSRLGAAYMNGTGVPQDTQQALKWLTLAANQGDNDAKERLSILSLMAQAKATPTPEDSGNAVTDLFRQAASGDAAAQIKLGDAYRDGTGVTQDAAQAAYWYKKAADQGSADAKQRLGALTPPANTTQQTQNQPQQSPTPDASSIFVKASNGDVNAQLELGDAYRDGQGIGRDATQAAFWYRKAADQGNADAKQRLDALTTQQTNHNTVDLSDLFRRASGGDADAQVRLGNAYKDGASVSRDYTQAAYWYRKAADQGNVWGESHLGSLYMDGTGVTKNTQEASKWLKLAADQGNVDAKQRLAAISNAKQQVQNPLSESDIRELLSNGVAASRVTVLVKQYGVDFSLNDDKIASFRQLGADSDLLLAISTSKR